MQRSLMQRALAWLAMTARSLHGWAAPMKDADWFDANVRAATTRQDVHRHMPGAPANEAQIRFTGRSGVENLQQAFDFYRFCRPYFVERESAGGSGRILDFGCGWGRIARFWLRDTPPSHLWCLDCMADAVELLHTTRMPAHIVKNDPAPPVAGVPASFQLIYAFSVFSHLSEALARQWMEFFAQHLEPGGYLIFTTRGQRYLAGLRGLRVQPPQDEHQIRMLAAAPAQEELERCYASGKFVFFGTGGGGELAESFYGEALIPEAWLSAFEHLGLKLRKLEQHVAGIDQAIVVMQKAFGI
jgi:hypothetical protein